MSNGIGLREWLTELRIEPALAAAAFDTRIDRPRVPGSASRTVAKRLRRIGAHVIAPAESFYVSGTEGPLLAGELERAHLWGEQLGSTVNEAAAHVTPS